MRKSPSCGIPIRALAASALLLLFIDMSFAQGRINLLNGEKVRTPEEREKDRAIEKAYQNQMKKIPDQKPVVDPWSTGRSSSDTTRKPLLENRKANAELGYGP